MHIPGHPVRHRCHQHCADLNGGFQSQMYMDKSQLQAPDSLSSRGEKAKARAFAQGSARGGTGLALIHLYCLDQCFNFISELNPISTYTGAPVSSQGGRSNDEDNPKWFLALGSTGLAGESPSPNGPPEANIKITLYSKNTHWLWLRVGSSGNLTEVNLGKSSTAKSSTLTTYLGDKGAA